MGIRRAWRVFAILVLLAAGVLAAVGGVARADDPGQTTTTTTTSVPTPNGPITPNDVTTATIAPVCGDGDGSEPLVFNCPLFTKVVDRRYYEVPGTGSVSVHFDYVLKFGACDNQLAVFRVDDPSGSINGVLPGNASWPSEVASRAQLVFGSGSNPFSADVDLTFQGGDLLGLRFTGCGVNYYSYEQANPDGFDHLLAFQNVLGQPWQFAWEDLFGGGDRDFDDTIVNIGGPGGGGFKLPPGTFIALGDSYSSGEGNPPFFAGTDGPHDYCHRSPEAYPEVLGQQFNSLPLLYACSGATTWNVTQVPQDTEPFQLDHPDINSSTRLVTMTIGGNNAGFSDVLKACIEQKLKADVFNSTIVGTIGGLFGFGMDPSCAHSEKFVSSVSTAIDDVFWPVKLTERDILVHVDPAATSIMVAGYPHIFPDNGADCVSMSLIFTKDDETWLNDEGDRLVGVLQEAAAEAGVSFVDVRDIFHGHEECGDQGSYLNGISFASWNGGSCTYKFFGVCVIPGAPIVGSFHPNASGHADGYAAAIRSDIDSAAVRTPAGFPANPPPTPDPPSAPVPPAVGLGELTVQPVTTGTADCEGTYQAGQELHLSGGGFAPGTSVQVYASAGGLVPNGELLLTTLIADAGGSIDGIVRIPLSATGFGPADAAAGLVFLDAIGVGSAADNQDDIAMAGLAPHDSTCGTVDQLPFTGFTPPVKNLPQVNTEQPGQAVPVTFSIPGSNGTLNDVFAPGYPQSTSVSCASPGAPSSGEPTASASNGSPPPANEYNYVWKTDSGWRGCRMLIVRLIDGTYHRALFDFGA